jgi:phenylalanyl-tRNA synthetase beta subunit
MAGALESIKSLLKRTLSQANVKVTNNMITTVIAAVAGSRIRVRRFEIGTDTAAKFSLRSGNVDDIIDIHLTEDDFHSSNVADEVGLYVGNVGEALTIQSSVASLDANVYVQYWYDDSGGTY